MRTSLSNIKAIEDFLSGRMDPADALLFRANMLLDDELVKDVGHQQHAYAIIRQYSRQKIKGEILALQYKLAHEPQHQGFMQRINNLFLKH